MAVSSWVWGENVALECLKFWMRCKYPNTSFKVGMIRNEYNLTVVTRIAVTAKDGSRIFVEFVTALDNFTADGYVIPQETQAQLMLLLE